MDGERIGGFVAGWRGLARFWAGVVAVLAIVGGVLQALGPPAPRVVVLRPVAEPPAHPEARTVPAVAARVAPDKHALQTARVPTLPGRTTPGPIADPDPALLEPYGPDPKLKLPRIGSDGRAPMAVYAAGFDPSSLRPRVAVLVAGIGMSEADSIAAVKTLPGGVTLAISPYASDISRVLSVARMAEHEYLLAIPMEPQGYPVNDPDDRYALMTSLSPTENLSRLQAILARMTGYAGVTNALGQMRGERLAGMTDQFEGMLEEVGQRGLLFLDARPGQPPLAYAWNRSADIVLDAGQIDAAVLDQRLDALTHLALDKGSALAVVSIPRPLTVERVAAWTNTLASKGVALAPVSALAQAPVKLDAEK